MVLRRRRVAHDVVGDAAVGDRVGALLGRGVAKRACERRRVEVQSLRKVHSEKLRTGKMRAEERRAGEMHPTEPRASKMCAKERRVGKMRLIERRVGKMRPLERCAG